MPAKLIRNAHFLGTKIRNLRKRHRLTMEDLSERCMRLDRNASPSVSYLSMIERGKRHPSEAMLAVIARAFQRDVDWFLNDSPDEALNLPSRGGGLGPVGMALEPGFLFDNENLQIAIPELLSQAGVSGRQFAQLLIRAHQERHQNRFPELERAAEAVGQKQMPLHLDAIHEIRERLGLEVRWFERLSRARARALGVAPDTFVRSYFEPPATIHLNRVLDSQPDRKKYDLAVYIGHKVLHDGDGMKSPNVAGRRAVERAANGTLGPREERVLDAQDILHAWRDFECSFFAGALLCPRVPFRRLLERCRHDVLAGGRIDVSASVVMRRMTAVSTYPYWHYFDAFPPGQLNAVYRGNGIPLPWGNMRLVNDPCQHWAVFRMLNSRSPGPSAQISLLDVGREPHIYCCESLRIEDLAGEQVVLCAGIDVNPALEAQGHDAAAIAGELRRGCIRKAGSTPIGPRHRKPLLEVAELLNIEWLSRGVEAPAQLICPRSGTCPREPKCNADA